MVSSNEFLLNPVLPATDLGEAEENNSGKRKSSTNELRKVVRNVKARTGSQICSELRRERGFPGIEVALIRLRTSLATVLDSFGCRHGDFRELRVAEPVTSETTSKVDEVVDLTEFTSPYPELDNDHFVTGMGEALSGTDSVLTKLNSLPDLSYGGQDWGPNPKKDEKNHSDGFVACSKAARASRRKSTLDDCIRHWSSDTMEKSEEVNKPHLIPDLLKAAYSAVEQAGEEGLALQKLAEYLQLAGMDVSNELGTVGSYVQALESFGLLKRVNAVDHIRIVEASKCSRFFLHISHEDDFENSQQSFSRPVPNSGKQLICIPQSMGTVVGGCDGGSESNERISRFDTELVGKLPDLAASQLLIGSSTTTSVVNAKAGDHRIISLKPDGCRDVNTEHVDIVPWLSQNGTVNKPMLKGLIRRVMGIITIHPGISEGTLAEQIKILNPQSVRKLIQILELDGHLVVRSLPGPTSAAPPRLLQTLTGYTNPISNTSPLKHYFVNPLADRHL